jgi:hypothetical protein
MAAVKILDKREIPSADPTRVGKMDAMITYQIDTFRTYLITIPNEELTPEVEDEVIRAAIRKDMAERERWAGKEIEI